MFGLSVSSSYISNILFTTAPDQIARSLKIDIKGPVVNDAKKSSCFFSNLSEKLAKINVPTLAIGGGFSAVAIGLVTAALFFVQPQIAIAFLVSSIALGAIFGEAVSASKAFQQSKRAVKNFVNALKSVQELNNSPEAQSALKKAKEGKLNIDELQALIDKKSNRKNNLKKKLAELKSVINENSAKITDRDHEALRAIMVDISKNANQKIQTLEEEVKALSNLLKTATEKEKSELDNDSESVSQSLNKPDDKKNQETHSTNELNTTTEEQKKVKDQPKQPNNQEKTQALNDLNNIRTMLGEGSKSWNQQKIKFSTDLEDFNKLFKDLSNSIIKGCQSIEERKE